MNDARLTDLRAAVLAFRDARNWRRFHTPKNLTLALASEVGEIADLVRWASDAEILELARNAERSALADEIADVQMLLLLLADALDIDIAAAVHAKLDKNGEKYPVDRASARLGGSSDE